jgi:hypothetical protein
VIVSLTEAGLTLRDRAVSIPAARIAALIAGGGPPGACHWR